MPYFAKIEHERVIQVIVAEPEYVATLEGVWLETTHGALGGVHYNEQWQLDALPVLRKNFASVGGFYDPSADAFYGPQSSKLQVLDLTTHLWTYAQPNLTDTMPGQRAALGEVTFLVHPSDFAWIEPLTWVNLKRVLGVSFTSDAARATHALPLADRVMTELLRDTSRQTLWPMQPETFFRLTDRVGMQALDLPTLPTYLPTTPEELLALPDKPVFVKTRRTYTKQDHPLAYTAWKSPKALLAATDTAFWENQQQSNSSFGEFIIQPDLSHPLTTLNLHVAVNERSEALVWAKMLRTHPSATTFGNYVPFEGDCTELVEQVQRVCAEQALKMGFHQLDLARYNDQWCLMDWNARLTGPFIQCLANFYPVLHDPFLHALGQPLRGETHDQYVEQRCYPGGQITSELMQRALHMHLLPFHENGAIKLSALGPTKEEVQSRFILFESFL